MAKLNEPPGATETLETLKRKFLRQNAVLAKANSLQSLQIRQLELDRARLLSENLGLRGTVIDLETRLREGREKRIAEHALEIKARMEAQLLEWGALLAGLGEEPPPKPTPRARKVAKTSLSSIGTSRLDSPSHAQWKEKWKQIEMSPIFEHKVLPRAAADDRLSTFDSRRISDSPEMPSPAVSRLAGSLQSEDMESPSQAKADSLRSVPDAVPLRLNPKTEDALRENGPQGSQSVSISASKPNAKSEAEGGDVHKQIEPEPAMRTVRMLKTGAKRKLAVRDDDEGDRKPASHQTADTPNPVRTQSHAATPLRDQAAGRPLREIASLRRESRARSTPTPSVVEGTRRPLATKSTNDDMASPQKASRTAKLTPVDDIAAAKSLVLKTMRSTDRLDAKKREKTALDKTTVEKTTIEKSTLGKTNLEKTTAETTTRGSSLSEPSAPRQQRQDNQTSSTPPQRKGRGRTEPAAVPSPPSSPVVADVAEPTDHGKRRTSPDTQPPPSVRATTTATGDEETEGSRPSRRARLAVSYAEPNLRVKMRRPTEALFDAVTGEGKTFVRRQSSLSLSDAQQVSGSAPTSTQQVQVHHGRSKSTGDCLGDGGRVTEKEKDKNKDKNGDKDDKDRDKNRDKDDKDRDKDKDKDRERPGSSATTTAAELGLATQRRQQTKTLPDDDQASSKSEVAVEKPRARSSAAASKTADGGRRAYVASSSSSRARSLAVVKDDGITEPSDIDVTDSDVVDPYEFIASPPRSSQPPEQQHITVRPSKSARRLSSITAADILPADDDDASAAGQTTMRGVAGRKRASMNLPSSSSLSSRRSMMDLSDDSYEGGDVGELSSRITTRRKSTLL